MNSLVPDLASRIRQGSLEALEELYRAASTDLLRLATRMCRDPNEAADTVHDVFVGLPAALQQYEERGQFGAWLRRITARTVIQRARARTRSEERDARYAADRPATSAPVDGAVSAEDALARLPLSLRSVVVLKELEGMSHGEIAMTLGITATASRLRLWRGLEQLRQLLGEDRS
jgi:RNA polymerase sigma-70 factor (ECF subfamily)